MGAEFAVGSPDAEGAESHPQSFPARETHRGNHVGIAAHHNDGIHQPFERQRGNIEADPHVYALLHQVGDEVAGRNRPLGLGLELALHRPADAPAPEHHFTAAHGEIP